MTATETATKAPIIHHARDLMTFVAAHAEEHIGSPGRVVASATTAMRAGLRRWAAHLC